MQALYHDLGSWWPLLSPLEDYAGEAGFFAEVFAAADLGPGPTLLELGCGGGHNAWYLKAGFAACTLTDLAPEMLAISQGLNPDCEHLVADMRSLRLDRSFDAVFVHDAICYMSSREALCEAIETAWIHCRPGGLALFVPDETRESFEPMTESGGADAPDGSRSLRYLEWVHDPDPEDEQIQTEYVCLLREGEAPVRSVHETHIHGLFPRAVWIDLLQAAGFTVESLIDPYERELFLARRPA